MGRAAKGTSKRGKQASSPYSLFFNRELKRLKEENPEISHKDAFKQAGLNWRNSTENPKNQAGGAPETKAKPTAAPVSASIAAPIAALAAVPVATVAVVSAPAAATEPVAATEAATIVAAVIDPLPVVADAAPVVTDVAPAEGDTLNSGVVRRDSASAGKTGDDKSHIEGTAAPASSIMTMASHTVNATLTAAK
ncbi:hypothetical protein LPJ66_002041 [Kickxella alabastrina]|uniref:Uncharacterized protein n=1 Tax=Kickxella alabastrina TaxID=61397 RepID=A0ACC1IRN6_9FUNG|nr:hypothetical protein LPJ66_002041 [Kickxella alabastrina]